MINKQIACIKRHLPEGWTCGEGCFMSLSGSTSKTHIWVSPPEMPDNCRYHGDNTTAEERRELRAIELAHRKHMADQIVATLSGYASQSTGLLKGKRVVRDGTTVYVH